MKYEHHKQKLLPPSVFYYRVTKHLLYALVFIIISLGIGASGYHHFSQLGWVDSLYNASLILTGMGPVDIMPTDAAKIFASCYAIYSGVAFLSAVAMIFTPIVHRLLHIFHIDDNE